MNDESHVPAIPSEDLRGIIRRAVDLDLSHRDLLSHADVHAIASQLGISEDAIVQALHEYSTPSASRRAWHTLLKLSTSVGLKGVVPGMIIGAIFSSVPAVFDSPLWPLLPLGAVGVLALSVSTPRTQLTFHVRNLALFSGVVLSYIATFGVVPPILSSITLAWLGTTSAMGGAIVWLRNRLASRGQRPPSSLLEASSQSPHRLERDAENNDPSCDANAVSNASMHRVIRLRHVYG